MGTQADTDEMTAAVLARTPTAGKEAGESDPVLGDVLRHARLHHRLTLRQVERQIGIPNAHLSQIERGVIRQPNPSVLMELAELYELNYTLIAEWAGYLDSSASRTRRDLAGLALRLFVDLDPLAQQEALDYLECLRNRRPNE
ncbi:MAG: helix-turn-helix transcriptional regulator [Actinomycetota bacterium]|nr:helix-turn-helix transcriptional regulator [Actinomycetota bacterium]